MSQWYDEGPAAAAEEEAEFKSAAAANFSNTDIRAMAAAIDPSTNPAAAAEEQEIPPPVAVKMKELDWSEYVQDPDDPITDADFCLWCDFAVCANDLKTGNKHWEQLIRYHNENWGRVHPFKFARDSQRIYNEHIRLYLTDNDKAHVVGPAWPAQSIHEHPITHVFIARCAHIENAFVYQTALRRMRDNGLFMSDGTVNTKLLKLFFDTEKQARVLFEKIDTGKGSNGALISFGT